MEVDKAALLAADIHISGKWGVVEYEQSRRHLIITGYSGDNYLQGGGDTSEKFFLILTPKPRFFYAKVTNCFATILVGIAKQ